MVETALSFPDLVAGVSPRSQAVAAFSDLRMWDTTENNGVMVYMLLADRAIELVADRGFEAKVTAEQWEIVCASMEAEFRADRYMEGCLIGIDMITELIADIFPADGPSNNPANAEYASA